MCSCPVAPFACQSLSRSSDQHSCSLQPPKHDEDEAARDDASPVEIELVWANVVPRSLLAVPVPQTNRIGAKLTTVPEVVFLTQVAFNVCRHATRLGEASRNFRIVVVLLLPLPLALGSHDGLCECPFKDLCDDACRHASEKQHDKGGEANNEHHFEQELKHCLQAACLILPCPCRRIASEEG